MKALYVGRFQPFHKGHLEYVKRILKENDSLTILIGSSQEKNTFRNPFSVRERKEMIAHCLEDVKNVMILTARDYPGDNNKWLAEVEKKASFDVVYSGENKALREIFTEAGYQVKTVRRINGIRSTDIRNRIIHGNEWQSLVPGQIYNYIVSINGSSRVRKTQLKPIFK
jgi:nicotinamide-nucleotide adenylyltransferase